jgi:sec-independent protein translocase protein TatA
MPFGLGPLELLVILVIVLIVVGPGKLPSAGAAMGRAIREFREALEGTDNRASQAQGQPQQPPQQNQGASTGQDKEPPRQG